MRENEMEKYDFDGRDRASAKLGVELVALHLMEFEMEERGVTPSSRVGKTAPPEASTYQQLTEFIGGENPEVEKVSFAVVGVGDPGPAITKPATGTVFIDKAQTAGLRGVPEHVWNFHIGGYQVCEKWLKDRKGRMLTMDDLEHYHRIVVALSQNIRLMAEIDQVIEKHGGWPNAFNRSAQ